MNLPGAIVNLPTLTEKDVVDLTDFGIPQNVDFIAASFVRKGADIDFIRSVLGEQGGHIKIIAKIEVGNVPLFLLPSLPPSLPPSISRSLYAVFPGASRRAFASPSNPSSPHHPSLPPSPPPSLLLPSLPQNQEGLNNYEEILTKTDGIMVARGDLGMEIPPEKVFLAQKMMINKANIRGTPT